MIEELHCIVETLNQEMFEKYGEDISQQFMFSITSTGYFISLNFLDQLVWNTEEDGREWIEGKSEYEPLEPFIRKRINEIIQQISKISF